MTNQNPEQIARDNIDKQLAACGWTVQSKREVNLGAALGVAVREYQTDVGPADYVLFVDKKPVGIIEAKEENKGFQLTQVEDQSTEYAQAKLKYLNNDALPVVNEEKLFKYHNEYKEQIETAVDELAEIFLGFEPKDRSHKTELLATVCKVVEDVQTTEIEAVRQSMAEWKIDLKNGKFKNKAEKFDEEETAKCVAFIIKNGWDKKLIS